MGISDLRREYGKMVLDRDQLEADPLLEFRKWFAAASEAKNGRLRRFAVDLYKTFASLFTGSRFEPNVMTLATADTSGRPSARTVLLKGADERGFTFFTNYDSRKGHDLADNPRAALVFYWPDLERQICVEGSISKLPREESETYFKSRPRGARISAWTSPQSTNIADRNVLAEKYRQIESQFAGQDVPLPPFWGGYLLKPDRIEFWQGRANRLHDRFCYTREEGNTWRVERLAP